MSAVAVDALPEGQQEALEALRSIARDSDGALMVDLDYERLGGTLTVRVYLSSASLLSGQDVGLVDWEPIDILIPKDFPYRPPIAWGGRDDFPELPHQAQGSKFCVRVEQSNWDPTAGMRGFLRAVIDIYQHIALGTLSGRLQAWRPMVAYVGQGWAVIKADLAATDPTESGISFRWAVGIQVNDNRIDIIEWLDDEADALAATDLTEVLTTELARINAKTRAAFLIPAVVVAKPIALEYSRVWIGLLVRLHDQGVDADRLIDHLVGAATISPHESVGQERAAVLFRVAADTEPTAAGQDARFAVARLTQHDVRLLAGIHAAKDDADAYGQMLDEFLQAEVPWVRVYDGRPESILRRTVGRATEKLAGVRVLLLGCGGLGAPIAEHCARSGAARVHIVDSGTVSPGVLSRQPYEDADIGKPKAEVLAGRLGRIRPENKFTASAADIVFSDLFHESGLGQYDLIIDATANRSVAAKIERVRRDQRDPWPPLVTIAISQYATHGVAAVTPQGTVGAGIDLLRRLGLRTCMSTALSDVHTAFFPAEASRLNFRPDTSSSDTTFVGSVTDIGALAAQLMDSALARFDPQQGATADGLPHRSLSIVRLGRDNGLKAARVLLDLPPDRVVMDHGQTYEVRIDETAMETIREHVRASVHGRTPGTGHTAGLLLGQFDSVCRIAWVSQATGLPPGSTATPLKIDLDMAEVRAFLADRNNRSGGMLTLIGFWHTHRGSSTAPSETDHTTMRELVASPEWRSAPALLLILGLPEDGSTGEPASPWLPEIHAETFAT
jgi:ThiF family/Prokaryotic E2 family A/Prokaryotic homologs of the JAB domain